MSLIDPWDGKYSFALDDITRDDLLRQRITRALEKAQEDGVRFNNEWEVQTLADRLFDKIILYFYPQRLP